MKIQYALMSCTAQPHYTEYWPIVVRAWLGLGITPVCLFIPDTSHKLPEVPGGIVHTIPHLRDVPISIQGLTLRYWGSYLYPNATVIISDMDIIPLSKDFFCTQLAPFSEHAYLHLPGTTANYFYNVSNIPEKITCIQNMRYLSGWFHVAKGQIMFDVLKMNPDWATSCRKTIPYYLHKDAAIKSSGHPLSYLRSYPFYGDEIYTSIRLHHARHRPIFYSPYSGQYNIMLPEMLYIREVGENLSCIHLGPHRYTEYKETIDLLLTERKLPPPQTPMGLFMDCLTYLAQKIKIGGPWLALILLTLSMLIVRVFYRRQQREVLELLWLKRQVLLITKYPSMLWLQNQAISLKKRRAAA